MYVSYYSDDSDSDSDLDLLKPSERGPDGSKVLNGITITKSGLYPHILFKLAIIFLYFRFFFFKQKLGSTDLNECPVHMCE